MSTQAFNNCVKRISAVRDEVKDDSILERWDLEAIVATAQAGGSVFKPLFEGLTEFNMDHPDVLDRGAEAGLDLGDELVDGTKQS